MTNLARIAMSATSDEEFEALAKERISENTPEEGLRQAREAMTKARRELADAKWEHDDAVDELLATPRKGIGARESAGKRLADARRRLSLAGLAVEDRQRVVDKAESEYRIAATRIGTARVAVKQS